MIKVSNLVEQIFAQAVALDQSGGLKNTIFVIEDRIYVMNYDHSVLLRFKLRKSENVFPQSISFKANDYDSEMFEQKDNKIIFHQESDRFSRKKICGTTDITPEEVDDIFNEFYNNDSERQKISLNKEILSLLDDELSHIEFSAEPGEGIKLIQRNIYSGGIIEVKEKKNGLFHTTFESGFGPLGMKTGDFKALFNFQDNLDFYFPQTEDGEYVIVESTDQTKRNMCCVVSCCLYDEIIQLQQIKKEEPHGRKKQEKRRGE